MPRRSSAPPTLGGSGSGGGGGAGGGGEQPSYCTSLRQIQAAAARIAPFVHRTPVLTSRLLDSMYSAVPMAELAGASAGAGGSLNRQDGSTAPSSVRVAVGSVLQSPPTSRESGGSSNGASGSGGGGSGGGGGGSGGGSGGGGGEGFGGRLYFKCELFQRTGSFKVRGALNAVLGLSDEAARRGVVTHSSGNHAQAVALAARLRGIPAYVVMPRGCPQPKLDAVRDTYKATVFQCEPTNAARVAMAAAKQREHGAEFIHPSNDPRVISGQGTIALELLDQVAELQTLAGGDSGGGGGSGGSGSRRKQQQQVAGLDAVIIPLGGGGMISGMAVALKARHPGIKVFGAEPANAADAAAAKAAGDAAWKGSSQHTGPVHTCADGLKTCILDNNWPVVRDLVDEIVTVTEAEILGATELLYTRMKLAVEPSAGTGLAVALQPAFRARRFRHVGVVLCGGNIDVAPLFDRLRARFVDAQPPGAAAAAGAGAAGAGASSTPAVVGSSGGGGGDDARTARAAAPRPAKRKQEQVHQAASSGAGGISGSTTAGHGSIRVKAAGGDLGGAAGSPDKVPRHTR